MEGKEIDTSDDTSAMNELSNRSNITSISDCLPHDPFGGEDDGKGTYGDLAAGRGTLGNNNEPPPPDGLVEEEKEANPGTCGSKEGEPTHSPAGHSPTGDGDKPSEMGKAGQQPPPAVDLTKDSQDDDDSDLSENTGDYMEFGDDLAEIKVFCAAEEK